MAQKQRSVNENQEKSFFHQAAVRGYETEIANLKKEIEQIQETTQVRNRFYFLLPNSLINFSISE
jgi:hypothetical protein